MPNCPKGLMTHREPSTHGILSSRALILTGEGIEDPREFTRFSDETYENLVPYGAVEELLVGELIDIAWHKRHIPVCETAVINNQLA
ncbi:MAG: hypothetical protein H8E48_14825 [Chloroflexi bacterium]|nr:hypothetical protein [Chloroflexota bacterium]